MIIQLPYGKEYIEFKCDLEKLKLVTLNCELADIGDQGIIERFYNPIDYDSLDKFIKPEDKVLIVVSDATRYTASDRIIKILLWELASLGVKRNNIEFIISLGMHRLPTVKEMEEILGRGILENFKINIHNAFESKNMIFIGVTTYGTPVYINKILYEFDKVIIISAIGYHYFAGYSGGRKSLVPGLASIETIKANHRLVIDEKGYGKNPNATIGKLKGNPVHLDLMEAAKMIKVPIFCINTILHRKRLVDVICGDIENSFYRACEEFARISSVEENERRDLVIASCGGYPRDINVIQSLKSLENATYFCKRGGVIILLSRCKGGWGNKEFSEWLKYDDVNVFKEKLIRHYAINAQPAFTWRLHSINYNILMVSDLASSFQRKLNVKLFNSFEDALKEALSRLPDDYKGFLIPYCWETVPSNLVEQ